MANEEDIFANVEIGKSATPDEFGKTIDLNSAPVQSTAQQEDDDSESDVIASQSQNEIHLGNTIKLPQRKNMDGQIVRIKDVKITPPAINSETKWKKSKKSAVDYVDITFRVFYESDNPEFLGQSETYAGLKGYKKIVEENGVKKIKISVPAIWGDEKRPNQLYLLKKLYDNFVGKTVTDDEFEKGLKSGLLRAKLKSIEYDNPTTGAKTAKNIIVQLFK